MITYGNICCQVTGTVYTIKMLKRTEETEEHKSQDFSLSLSGSSLGAFTSHKSRSTVL